MMRRELRQQTIGLAFDADHPDRGLETQRGFEQAASRRLAAREANADTTPEARRAAARTQREQVDSELRQILTAEQMSRLEAERANHRGRQGGHGRGHQGGRGRGHQGGHHGQANGQRPAG